MTIHSLSSILNAIFKLKKNNKTSCISKRLIFNQAPVGGISSMTLIVLFISFPFMEYAAIFNPYVFNYFGIAQSIVVFIVSLVVIMQVIFVLIWRNNKKTLSRLSSSWNSYFPDVDLKLVLSSGVSPYNDFYKAYCEAATASSNDEQLHQALSKAFALMQEQNRDLLEAIQRDTKA